MKISAHRLYWTTALLFSVLLCELAACHEVLGIEEKVLAASGGGGIGGEGGSSAPGCLEQACCTDSDCPPPTMPCQKAARCTPEYACSFEDLPAGTVVAHDDCTLSRCDESGKLVVDNDGDYIPDDGNECTVDACVDQAPVHTPASVGTKCWDPPGGRCDGSGKCLECLNDDDCQVGSHCKNKHCYPNNCNDGIENGAETDIDCGGPTCLPCATGKGCTTGSDCSSLSCDQMNGVCLSPSCGDSILNGNESDTDCGGASCPDKCSTGKKCHVASDCSTSFCVDGVCCGSTCDGLCRACIEAKTGVSSGTCASFAKGTDPDNECAVQAQGSCGNDTGACDGAGACSKYPAGVLCGDPPSCSGGVETALDHCDGAGACVDGGSTPCAPYVCGGLSCKKSCSADGDCVAGYYCASPGASGVCTLKLTNGSPCSAASQCQSNQWADGVCCDVKCDGQCKACSAAKTGGASGFCAPVSANTDPDSECPTECNGNGACELPQGSACGAASECQTGSCVDGICCTSSCGGTCFACSSAKTGAPNGTCAPVLSNQDPDNECANGDCNGAGACESPIGSGCSNPSQCQSGFCTDGVCCNEACTGTCKSCVAPFSFVGFCSPIPGGQDPDSECYAACNGSGGCQCPNGVISLWQTKSGTTVGKPHYFNVGCGSSSSGPQVTYVFTAPSAGTYFVDTSGSSFDVVIGVLDAGCGGPLLGCEDGGIGNESVLIDMPAGATVTLIIAGFGGAAGNYNLHVEPW